MRCVRCVKMVERNIGDAEEREKRMPQNVQFHDIRFNPSLWRRHLEYRGEGVCAILFLSISTSRPHLYLSKSILLYHSFMYQHSL